MEEITTEWKPQKPWLLIVPVMFAAFMFALDQTIANIALPHMAGSFSVSSQESIWVLTSYLIASCLTIPMLDWLSKLLGRKLVFMSCVILFTISSFFCGISTSIEMMVISRFMQGLGGGILIPVAQSIIMESFKGRELNTATAIFGGVVIMAPIIGPVLGGWITENYSWNWIFFINVPIGIIVTILSVKFFEEPPYASRQKNVHTDYWGILFLILFAIAFEIMIDKGNDQDWFGSPFICRLTFVWVTSLILLIISQIKQKDSLIKFDVLKNYNFSVGTIVITVMTAIMLSSMAMLPQFMQNMMGYSAFTSGLSMMPRGIGSLCGLALVTRLVAIFDPRLVACTGVLILSLASWLLGFVNLQISPVSVVIPNVLYGFGMALGMMPIVTLSCLTVPPEKMSNACGLQNFIKNIGGAVGTSLVATLISRFSQVHQNMLTHSLTETNPVYYERLQAYISAFAKTVDFETAKSMAQHLIYAQLNQQAHLWAFIDSFRIYALAGVLVLICILVMQKKTWK
ncbi:MAG: DHA2 family efflux MFS transporter permease subunit [bacterium]|nr:DHA2 family efflux MFS transporter permease subunit [bacterium]